MPLIRSDRRACSASVFDIDIDVACHVCGVWFEKYQSKEGRFCWLPRIFCDLSIRKGWSVSPFAGVVLFPQRGD